MTVNVKGISIKSARRARRFYKVKMKGIVVVGTSIADGAAVLRNFAYWLGQSAIQTAVKVASYWEEKHKAYLAKHIQMRQDALLALEVCKDNLTAEINELQELHKGA
nr:hypothetical protein [uncultured Anaeromusa sp.]